MLWDKEGLGERSGPRPWHGEGAEVRDLKCFCDVNACKSAGAFDQDISALASFPRRHEEFFDPARELGLVSGYHGERMFCR